MLDHVVHEQSSQFDSSETAHSMNFPNPNITTMKNTMNTPPCTKLNCPEKANDTKRYAANAAIKPAK